MLKHIRADQLEIIGYFESDVLYAKTVEGSHQVISINWTKESFIGRMRSRHHWNLYCGNKVYDLL